jgi:Chaperone of endosialidase
MALFKEDPPQPPSPTATAGAQTSSNVSTAVANAFLNNMNQYTPQGELRYDVTDSYSWTDPTTGQAYNLPRFSVTQALSPQQQAINAQNQGTQLNLAGMANAQSGMLAGYLGQGLDLSQAPSYGNAGSIGNWAPLTSFDRSGLAGQEQQSGINYNNPLQYGYNPGGDVLQAIYPSPTAAFTFGQAPGMWSQLTPSPVASSTFGNAPDVQQAITPSPTAAFTFDQAGQQQGTFGATPGVQGQLGYSPGAIFGFNNFGQPQSQFAGTTGPQSQFGAAGDITRSYGPRDDFSSDRARVEESLYGRLNPQLERERARLEQQLADQGIRYGSPAYTAAMDDYNRQANDLRLGVTQTAGQEQQRMMDMAAQRAGFQNAAQQQDYLQQQGRGAFANQAAAQAYMEAQGRGQFANAAQQAAFEQAMGQGRFYNEAAAQALAEQQARGQFANTAQQQEFGQAQARGQFANEAQQAAYNQALGRGQFSNQAVQQFFNEVQARQAAQNAAQQQIFQQQLGRGQFGNEAAQQIFNEIQARGQFANTAQQQQYAQELGRGQFSNQAVQQAFNEMQARAQFANQAQAQANAQNLGAAGFYNQAQQQGFGQAQAQNAAYNAAQQAAFQQAMGMGTFANAGVQQYLAQAQAGFNAQNALRQQYLQEQYAARNQPLNEISALLSGSQVQQPNFMGTPQQQIPTTDIAGLINNQFQQQFANYQAQQQAQNQLLGGILGAAGQVGAGYLRSDRREKENIHRMGTVFAEGDFGDKARELPIYKYSYKDDPAETMHTGPMAQDVEKIDPGAVVKDRQGTRYIKPHRVMGDILRAA